MTPFFTSPLPKHTIRWLMGLILTPFMVLLLLFGIVQTPMGKNYLAHSLERALSTKEMQLTLSGLEGSVPWDITLKTLIMRDASGKEQLVIQNMRLDWLPLALLNKKLIIAHLAADSVTVTTQPKKSPTPPAPTSDITALFSKLPQIFIHDVQIKRLTLNTGGQHFIYRLYGGVTPGGKGEILTSFHVETVEGPLSGALFTVGFTPDTSLLSLHVDIKEAAGGGIATLLALPSHDTLSLQLDGEGPVQHWQGRFSFSLSKEKLLTGTIGLVTEKTGLLAALDATITPPARLIPVNLQPELPASSPLQLHASAEIQQDGKIAIPSLTLANSRHQLQFTGTLLHNSLSGILTGKLTVPTSLGGSMVFTVPIKKTADILTIQSAKASVEQAIITADAVIDLQKKSQESTVIVTHPMLTARALFSGSLADPLLKASFEGKNLKHNTFTLPSLSGTLNASHLSTLPEGDISILAHDGKQDYHVHSQFAASPDYIDFTKITFSTLQTALNGTLRFYKKTALIEGIVEGAGTMADLKAQSQQDIKGPFHIKADFSQDNHKQQALVTLNATHLTHNNTTIRQADLTLQLNDAFAEKHIDASMELQGISQGTVAIESLKLTAKGNPQTIAFTSSAEGVASSPFFFNMKGTIETGEKLLVTLQDFSGKYKRLPFSLLKPAILRSSPQETSLQETVLQYATAKLTLKGSYDTKRSDIRLQLAELPLATLPFPIARYLSGTANGTLTITGNPASPTSTLLLRVSQLVYSKNARTAIMPPLTLTTNAVLKKGLFSVDTSLHEASAKHAALHVDFPSDFALQPLHFSLPANGALHGTLTSEINASSLTTLLLLDNQKLGGTLNTKILLSGTLNKPELTGTAALKGGLYEHNVAGILLHNINADVKITPNQLEIIHASASDGGKGRITATGGINTTKTSPLLISLVLDNCYLLRSDDLSIHSNGTATLSGALDAMMLAGKLTIDKAEIHIPDRIAPAITKLNVTEINEPVTQESKAAHLKRMLKKQLPAASPIGLDLAISLPNRIFLRGRGLDAELSGKLRITGDLNTPNIHGTLNVIRGRYQFIGQSFNITSSSTAIFRGTIPPSPFLDITAEAPAEDVTAQVKFTGTLSTPKLVVTSTPELPTEEVLSRLLFGRNLKTITPAQTVRLVSVTRELLGQNSDINFLDRTRSFLRLDDLDIKQGEQGESAFGIGKYVKKGIYVGAQKNLGSEGGKATIEIELSPHISVESKVGSGTKSNSTPAAEATTQGGVGLNWKYDY